MDAFESKQRPRCLLSGCFGKWKKTTSSPIKIKEACCGWATNLWSSDTIAIRSRQGFFPSLRSVIHFSPISGQ